MKIALAQLNSTVGDFAGNLDKMVSLLNQARENKADLVIFPESAWMGNPLKDAVLRPDFVRAGQSALNRVLPYTKGIGVILEADVPRSETAGLKTGRDGWKAHQKKEVLLIEDGIITHKTEEHGNSLVFRGLRLGFSFDTVDSADSPDLLISMSAFPYYINGLEKRIRMLSSLAKTNAVPLLAVNQVGGNDELIFDGSSMAFDKNGVLTHLASHFEEDLLFYDTQHNYQPADIPKEDISWVYRALILGLRDYLHKTGFKSTLLGLSGGVDSALAACLAVDALGRENVLGVYMPSRYSSEHSAADARKLAENLGIEYRILPIENIFASYLSLMNEGKEARGDLAEENIQARIRGDILMCLSNREGRMLINTSNKSESAVGYSTLYGDMCGGLAPIADIPKTKLYQLCEYINRNWERIPNNILTKPPSAELRPDQLDRDSLPDYNVLDEIIRMYVEENLSADEIAARGPDRELVVKIMNMIDQAEYKRRQAPPVLKITSHAFTVDGRMPVIQRFRRN
jgi:NAD+ synthase (glutamine-hydrolysing)